MKHDDELFKACCFLQLSSDAMSMQHLGTGNASKAEGKVR